MLHRMRKIAAKRDELIAREKAKADAEKMLARPAPNGQTRAQVRRRRRVEEAPE
jgi:DNA-directed RNA polymerase subunit beta'